MKTPSQLPEDYNFYIEELAGEIMFRIDTEQGNRPLAVMTIHTPTKSLDGGSCGGAWIVTSSNAKQGWGPLMYDVAIEWASLNGKGLAPDRDQVSDDALRVWDRYTQRSDVKHHPLSSGNCRLPKSYLRSSLSYRYTKRPERIPELQRLGKLREE